MMKTIPLSLQDVMLIENTIFKDDRGSFTELFNQDKFFRAVGKRIEFVQDNCSFSTKNVLRGLHYQINRRANRTRSIHATPQTTKHFPGRQARFQCPPSQTRTTRQTGAGRIRPLNTAFAMPVGMPQILFPIKPPAPNAGRFDVYSEEKANLSSSSAGVVYRPKAANHAHRRMPSEK